MGDKDKNRMKEKKWDERKKWGIGEKNGV